MANGLQRWTIWPAPMGGPRARPQLYWPKSDEGGAEVVLWPPTRALHEEVCEAERGRLASAQEREYRRLLYVAMTRAEDRLYVCGWQGAAKPAQDCWYDLVAAGLEGLAGSEEVAVDFTAGIPGLMATGRRLICRQDAPAKADDTAPDHPALPLAAAWADLAPDPEPARGRGGLPR